METIHTPIQWYRSVGRLGFEPRTAPLWAEGSNQLSYRPARSVTITRSQQFVYNESNVNDDCTHHSHDQVFMTRELTRRFWGIVVHRNAPRANDCLKKLLYFVHDSIISGTGWKLHSFYHINPRSSASATMTTAPAIVWINSTSCEKYSFALFMIRSYHS